MFRSLSAASILRLPQGSVKQLPEAHFKLFFQSCQKIENSWRLSELEGTWVIIHANANTPLIYSCIYSPSRYLLSTYNIQAQYQVLEIQSQSRETRGLALMDFKLGWKGKY